MTIPQLVQRIDAAFDGLPKPKVTKRVARAYDEERLPTVEHCVELRAQDERHWTDLTESGSRTITNFHVARRRGLSIQSSCLHEYHLRHFPSPVGHAYGCRGSRKNEVVHVEQLACVNDTGTMPKTSRPMSRIALIGLVRIAWLSQRRAVASAAPPVGLTF